MKFDKSCGWWPHLFLFEAFDVAADQTIVLMHVVDASNNISTRMTCMMIYVFSEFVFEQ